MWGSPLAQLRSAAFDGVYRTENVVLPRSELWLAAKESSMCADLTSEHAKNQAFAERRDESSADTDTTGLSEARATCRPVDYFRGVILVHLRCFAHLGEKTPCKSCSKECTACPLISPALRVTPESVGRTNVRISVWTAYLVVQVQGHNALESPNHDGIKSYRGWQSPEYIQAATAHTDVSQ